MDDVKLPEGTFTLRVPLDREQSKTAVFHITDMKEDVFMAASKLIDLGKDFEAVRMVIGSLQVGGDNVAVLKDNFVAMQSASMLIKEILRPIPGELKKN